MTFRTRFVPARQAVLIFCLCALAASVAAEPAGDLRARLQAIIAPVADRAFVGVLVQSLSRGETLFAYHPDHSFVPASNEKLLTSATALAELGPEFRFRTTVLSVPPAEPDKEGVLRASLCLRGGGDPVLETADLETLARSVREAGITRVSGALLADDSRFDAERLGSGWPGDDEPYYYSAQISGLSVNRNIVSVDVRPGRSVGARPEVTVRPLSSYLAVDNQARTGDGANGSHLEITRERAKNVLVVRGSVPLGSRGLSDEPVTVEDPTLYTALLFRKALAAAGVNVEGPTVTRAVKESAAVFASHDSPPLGEIVAKLNKPSDNLIAEMLLKTLGAEKGKKGSALEGRKRVEVLLEKAGADEERVLTRDGSGLSRRNLVTPRALVALLTYSRKQPYFEAFHASLPVAGVDGTLRRRMTENGARGRVRAKTGSLANVSALSGYLTTVDGEALVFSIMTNNFPGTSGSVPTPKQMEDRMAEALVEFRR